MPRHLMVYRKIMSLYIISLAKFMILFLCTGSKGLTIFSITYGNDLFSGTILSWMLFDSLSISARYRYKQPLVNNFSINSFLCYLIFFRYFPQRYYQCCYCGWKGKVRSKTISLWFACAVHLFKYSILYSPHPFSLLEFLNEYIRCSDQNILYGTLISAIYPQFVLKRIKCIQNHSLFIFTDQYVIFFSNVRLPPSHTLQHESLYLTEVLFYFFEYKNDSIKSIFSFQIRILL